MTGWRDMLETSDVRAGDERPVDSVTVLTRRIKRMLESGVGEVWVRGEVSNFRRQASGHCYFGVKDAGAQLSCVMFRGDAARQTVQLGDGQQVILNGRLSVYEARGQYQLVVRSVKEDGVGRLQREFEALKRRLAEAGLFAADRKRPLPELPLRVALVTSPTGAAVQDFVRIMVRRGWRGRLVVVPAKVQGSEAAGEIAAGIAWANAAAAFDVIVVARGGGSLEDLWAFNEEIVVRAVAASAVPVISAVGHEIDFSLTDFAADLRAETPSGAAEVLSSAYQSRVDRLVAVREELNVRGLRMLQEPLRQVRGLRDRLRLLTPRGQIEQGWLRRDDLANRLRSGLDRSVVQSRHRWSSVKSAWLRQDPQRRVEQASHELLSWWKRLQSVSPQATLKRGFALVRDATGQPVVRSTDVKAGIRYQIEFGDGHKPFRSETDE